MTIAEIVATPAASAGVSFLWTISLGQLITIGLAAFGGFVAVARIVFVVKGTSAKVLSLQKEVKADRETFQAALIRMEERHHEDLKDCRERHDAQLTQIRGSLDNLTQNVLSMQRIETNDRRSKWPGFRTTLIEPP